MNAEGIQPQSAKLQRPIWPEITVLLLITIELIWMVAWYTSMVGSVASWVVIFLSCAITAGGMYIIRRITNVLKWRESIQRLIFLIWLIVCILCTLKPVVFSGLSLTLEDMLQKIITSFIEEGDLHKFWHFFWMIIFAWRGTRYAQLFGGSWDMSNSFQLGLIMLLIYGYIYEPSQPQHFAILVCVYLFIGLLGLTVARISQLSELRGARLPRFGSRWVTGILIATLGILTFSLLMGWFASGQPAEFLITLIKLIFLALNMVILVILYPLLLLMFWVMSFLQQLLSPGMARVFEKLPLDILEQMRNKITEGVGITQNYRPIFLAAILAMMILLIIIGIRKRIWRKKAVIEDTVEVIQDKSAIKIPSSGLLDSLLKRRFMSPRRLWAAARIRRVYQQLIDLCARLGVVRLPATTPLEFLPITIGIFPTHSRELEIITNAYIKVRYGEFPETNDEVNQVLSAWDNVKKSGKKLMSFSYKKVTFD